MSWKTIASYRDVLESESGTVYKDWGGKISIALAYPPGLFVSVHCITPFLFSCLIIPFKIKFKDFICFR